MIEDKNYLGFIPLPKGNYRGVWESEDGSERYSDAVIGLAVIEETIPDEDGAFNRIDMLPILYSEGYGFIFGEHMQDEYRFIGYYDTDNKESEERMLINYVELMKKAKERKGKA